ncbi:hypothetical protein Hanom_Chr14g01250291 [Helianthus anomalus]
MWTPRIASGFRPVLICLKQANVAGLWFLSRPSQTTFQHQSSIKEVYKEDRFPGPDHGLFPQVYPTPPV